MTAPVLELLPAVDVAEGKAVRLTQGALGTETNYGDPWMQLLTGHLRELSGFTWLTLMLLSGAEKTVLFWAV